MAEFVPFVAVHGFEQYNPYPHGKIREIREIRG
jgi:hypothetical protein